PGLAEVLHRHDERAGASTRPREGDRVGTDRETKDVGDRPIDVSASREVDVVEVALGRAAEHLPLRVEAEAGPAALVGRDLPTTGHLRRQPLDVQDGAGLDV